MKNIIISIIVFALIYNTIEAKTLTLTPFVKAPVIDGTTTGDSWTNNWIDMTESSGSTSAMSAKFQIGYDNFALYIIVNVKDAHADTATNSWESDNVEVTISLDTTSYAIHGHFVSGSAMIRKQRDKEFPRGLDGWMGKGSSMDTSSIEGMIWSVDGFKKDALIAEVDAGTEYTQEWKLPWHILVDSMHLNGGKWDGKALKLEIEAVDNTTNATGRMEQLVFWNHNLDYDVLVTYPLGLIYLKSQVVSTPVLKSESLSMFPNPVDKILQIANDGNIKNVEVKNILGENIISLKTENNTLISVPFNNLKTGIYFVTVIDKAGRSFTSKIIKR